jgi:hypothetical protein
MAIAVSLESQSQPELRMTHLPRYVQKEFFEHLISLHLEREVEITELGSQIVMPVGLYSLAVST